MSTVCSPNDDSCNSTRSSGLCRYVLDNSTDFEGKMSRLVDIISKIVGLPSNLKRRAAKYLLQSPPDLSKFPPDIAYQGFEVEKVYLVQIQQIDNKDKDEYSFVRRRTNVNLVTGQRLGSVYQLTRVRKADHGDTIEQKRIISEREYAAAYEYCSCSPLARQRPIFRFSDLHHTFEWGAT